MMTYEKDLFGGEESIVSSFPNFRFPTRGLNQVILQGEKVITFLMQVLEAEESKSVQALMCLGLAKLMLFGIVTDDRVLNIITIFSSTEHSSLP